ncbi:hypothetical protein [Fibrella forsythiae]|uniref:Uncharacterized protein n=1 Tax=Fibrella forsythiae TaxID=2817061 RepID=A0ABS3JLW4_9BACT|nr:hypothetical protein [Fibrella forsythiae]MBO0950988.1 hypothetical protein [Fibrella forsythiae]
MWETILFFTFATVCLLIYLWHWNTLTIPMKWIGIAHAINTLTLAVGTIMTLNNVDNNLYIFHFSLLLLHTAYALAFYFAIDHLLTRKLILVSIGLFITISLIFSATIQPLNEFNSYSRVLSNLLLAGMSLRYLYKLFVEVKLARIEQNSFFWVSVGLLFTSVGSFFAYGLMSYLIGLSRYHAKQIYLLIDAMNFLLIGVLIVAVYVETLFTLKRHNR